jgi:pimeloyl-ACP methyl ester carboxylesterase
MRNSIKKSIRFLNKTVNTFILLVVTFFIISGTQGLLINNRYKEELNIYGKTANVNDLEFFYREAGENNDITLLMIHGFLGSSYDFIEIFEILKEDFRVIALDLIGFGLSSKPKTYQYSKDNQAEQVAAFIDYLAIDQISIIAHSMGGEVGMRLYQKRPDLIDKMILVGSVGPSENGLRQLNAPTVIYDLIVKNYFLQQIAFKSAFSKYEIDNKVINDAMFDKMFYFNRTIPGAVLKKMTQDVDVIPLSQVIDDVDCPILLVWGEDDGFVPLQTGLLLNDSLYNSSLVIFTDAGHLPFTTFANLFVNSVLDFILG